LNWFRAFPKCFLQLLQPLHLVRLEAAELLAPPIVGELGHADRAHRLPLQDSVGRQLGAVVADDDLLP
jgi:hypothetical protein